MVYDVLLLVLLNFVFLVQFLEVLHLNGENYLMDKGLLVIILVVLLRLLELLLLLLLLLLVMLLLTS